MKEIIIKEKRFLQKEATNATEKAITQEQIRIARIRLKVTTCLYLSPNNRARSLSTLMAVDTTIDTPQKTKIEA